jgi:hypothetical protein
MFVIGLLILVLLSLWRFVVVGLVLLQLGFVVCVGLYLVQRMNRLEDALDAQRALLGAARREISDLRHSEVDLREPVLPAEYVTSPMGPGGERPEWADTTWPGKSRYS